VQPKHFKSKNMMTTFIHSILFGKKTSDVRDPLGKTRIFLQAEPCISIIVVY
jgi:hypothetical protein